MLLDVVVAKRAVILQLLASPNQTLLMSRDALLILDEQLHVVNGVAWLDDKGDGIACQSLDEDREGVGRAFISTFSRD